MTEDAVQGKPRIVLLGDSITQGLGSKKVNFVSALKRRMEGYNVVNLAYTGTTIYYPFRIIDETTIGSGDIVVILYGNVDAQIRPSRTGAVFPRIPARFRKSGMLMPWPFYSSVLGKRLLQLIDNRARRFLSWLIVKIDGTEQWIPLPDFSNKYEELLGELRCRGAYTVCCSCVYIDKRLFPRTPEEYERYNAEIKRLAGGFGAGYLDIYSLMKRLVADHGFGYLYYRDHFHPNRCGYEHIAGWLERAIRDVLLQPKLQRHLLNDLQERTDIA